MAQGSVAFDLTSYGKDLCCGHGADLELLWLLGRRGHGRRRRAVFLADGYFGEVTRPKP